MLDYIPTINTVKGLLDNNKLNLTLNGIITKKGWGSRYQEYIDKLDKAALNRFKGAEKQFNVPAPFHLYMPLSKAINECSSRRTLFELRFHGQSVANIIVINNSKKVLVRIKAPKTITQILTEIFMQNPASSQSFENYLGKKDRGKELQDYSKMDFLDWHSQAAADFRKIYLELEKEIQSEPSLKKKLGQLEHDMECELLKNYSQKSSNGKEILNIQPVMMGDTNARFQMAVPLRACNAKSGPQNIAYSNKRSGNIDILARIGNGKGTKLAVLELKDSYSKDEPAEKVMHQAVAYAVFIRELLRSECGENWWKFFGFGGDIPKKLEIKAIVVMPDYPNADTSFGGVELPIGNDVLKLGYIYRTDDPANQKICI